ncbi:DUF6319 family protein [Pseudonocardia nigra]|uniref:DUF6319 family protein n=1 Tax=Pseudonocardia nigra TaxID=1921578 RepID=UPI003558F210
MASSLSEEDLAAARAEVSAGKPFTVWFTKAAVGVPVDGSAKVVSIADAAEGDFIEVRPVGTRDTMFCSPNELTRIRPARKRTQRRAEPAAKPDAAKAGAEPTAKPEPAVKPAEKLAAKPAAAAAAEPAVPKGPPAAVPASAAPEKRPDRPRPANNRAAARPAEVTVTLNANPDGEWTVEVVIGKKRSVRPTPVQPADVAKAARSLPSTVAEAIDSSLEAARQRQLERVERLRAELDAAQRALHELSG